MILKGYLFSVLYALVCLALAFVLYKVGVDKKITRKIVHILIGFEWIILYKTMGVSFHFLIVCIIFTLLLLLSHRKNLMPMISSDGDNAPGTVYYGVAMTIMATISLFVPDMILPFGIGVFCTSLGDGLAGLMGQLMNFPKNLKIYENKTLFGTIYNFIACFSVVSWFNGEFSLGLSIWFVLAIAAFSSILELFTGRGLDNITITLGTSLLSFALIYIPGSENYLVPVLLTPVIIAFANKKHALTLSGIVAAIVVDLVISITLGNFGFCILLGFFIGGIVVDKIKKSKKKTKQNQDELEKRGDCRDHVQVLVNSLVAAVLAVLYAVSGNQIFVVAFVAALAEAFADTVASGIGILSGRAYDVFRMRPCVPGLSGGMSIPGTVFSMLAALVLAIVAALFGRINASEVIIITFAAFLGAVFDSLLGSLVQVKYKCKKCNLITEREEHCGIKTDRYSGLSFVNNDVVNLLGTVFSAAVASLLYILI